MTNSVVDKIIDRFKVYFNKPLNISLDGIKSEHVVENCATGWWEEYRFSIEQAFDSHSILIIRCFCSDVATETFQYGNISLWNLHYEKNTKKEDLFELIDHDTDFDALAINFAKKFNLYNSRLKFIEFKLNQEEIFQELQSSLKIGYIVDNCNDTMMLIFNGLTKSKQEMTVTYTYDLKNNTFFEPEASTLSRVYGRDILTF